MGESAPVTNNEIPLEKCGFIISSLEDLVDIQMLEDIEHLRTHPGPMEKAYHPAFTSETKSNDRPQIYQEVPDAEPMWKEFNAKTSEEAVKSYQKYLQDWASLFNDYIAPEDLDAWNSSISNLNRINYRVVVNKDDRSECAEIQIPLDDGQSYYIRMPLSPDIRMPRVPYKFLEQNDLIADLARENLFLSTTDYSISIKKEPTKEDEHVSVKRYILEQAKILAQTKNPEQLDGQPLPLDKAFQEITMRDETFLVAVAKEFAKMPGYNPQPIIQALQLPRDHYPYNIKFDHKDETIKETGERDKPRDKTIVIFSARYVDNYGKIQVLRIEIPTRLPHTAEIRGFNGHSVPEIEPHDFDKIDPHEIKFYIGTIN